MEEEAKSAFEGFDADKDGHLTRSETAEALAALKREDVTDEDFEAVAYEGKVDFSQFQTLLAATTPRKE